MKRLKTGVVNTLSFVKLSTFTVNSFDVTLEKVVGTGSLTITNLTDLNNLDSCKDFIQINIDLISNDIEGGEYELTITNSGDSYKYLTEVQDYQYNTLGTGIYANSVVLSSEISNNGGGTSTSTNIWDNVYLLNELEPVEYITDTLLARVYGLPPKEDVDNLASELTIDITDSDGNTYNDSFSFNIFYDSHQKLFNLASSGLNKGDVWDVVIQFKNAGNVIAERIFNGLSWPDATFFLAQSLTDAQDYQSNGDKLDFTELDNLTTANIYTYVGENKQASLSLTSTKFVSSFMFVTDLPTNTLINQPINTSIGSLEESFIGIDLTPKQFAPTLFIVQLGCSWNVDGVTYSKIAEEINNTGYYSFESPITKEYTNKLYDGSVITLNGVDFNVTGDRLLSSVHPTLGDQSQLLSNTIVSIQLSAVEPGVYPKLFYFQNNGSNTKVMSREVYTDGTIVERSSITPHTINFNNTNVGNGTDPWGLVSFEIAETSKTLESVSVWLRFASDYIYNIDNGSINFPEFYFEP